MVQCCKYSSNLCGHVHSQMPEYTFVNLQQGVYGYLSSTYKLHSPSVQAQSQQTVSSQATQTPVLPALAASDRNMAKHSSKWAGSSDERLSKGLAMAISPMTGDTEQLQGQTELHQALVCSHVHLTTKSLTHHFKHLFEM